jgi:hypothetical protein
MPRPQRLGWPDPGGEYATGQIGGDVKPIRIVVCGAVLIAVASTVLAGDAKGNFVVKGGKTAGTIAPTQAAAYVTRDPRDPRKKIVEVILSDAAIDVDAAIAALQPHAQVINQDALDDRNYVLLWVAPDGHVSMNATFSQTMTQFVDKVGSSLKATLTTNTPERIAGRIFTVAPVKTMGGETYTVDLTFDTAVTRAPAATPIPAGGGAPGTALTAFLAAVKKQQWPAIKAGLAPAAVTILDKSYNSPEENASSAADLLQAWLPKSGLKIVGGELRGDTADLDVEGEMFPGTNALYLARMHQADGKWLFDSAGLIGMLP